MTQHTIQISNSEWYNNLIISCSGRSRKAYCINELDIIYILHEMRQNVFIHTNIKLAIRVSTFRLTVCRNAFLLKFRCEC